MFGLVQKNLENETAPASDAKQNRFARPVSGLLLVALALVMTGLICGYGVFRAEILSYHAYSAVSSSSSAPARDGIVVLTGDSNRIRTGMELLEKGAGKRLLISGVYQHTSKRALIRAANLEPDFKACCVDIGHVALDTRGNGVEASDWVKHQSFDRVLVVTSDYHMPRSLLELSNAMPGIELVPVVAKATDRTIEGGLVRREDWVRHTIKEYGKYLAAFGRILLEDGADDIAMVARSF